MEHEIQVSCSGDTYSSESFRYPAGELGVRIPGLPSSLDGDVTLLARLQSSDAIVRLLLVHEIVSRAHRSGRKVLVVPYLPYGRQDRVMSPEESFSLKAVARVVNSLQFDEVVTCDPHSDVTPALVERVRVVSQLDVLRQLAFLGSALGPRAAVVAPDAGAGKKGYAAARYLALPMVTAGKDRDVVTGEITGTTLNDPEGLVDDSMCLIVDDICDGGRTFTELAKVLRDGGAREVILYVTHGIFSKGLDVFKGLVDAVYTTDSFQTQYTNNPPEGLYIHKIGYAL